MTVTLFLNGRDYMLTFSTRVGMRFERLTGLTIDRALGEIEGGSLSAFVALMSASLQEAHPEMTLDRTAALIDSAGGASPFLLLVSAAGGSRMAELRAALQLGPFLVN